MHQSARANTVALLKEPDVLGRFLGLIKGSEASGIIEQAFRSLPTAPLPFDPKMLAAKLVAISYRSKPDLFDGRVGKPPRPVATAAVSLAGGLDEKEYERGNVEQQCLFLALGNVLLNASANMDRYGLRPMDMKLLSLSETAYLKHEAKSRADTTSIVGSLGL